jgi:hypothetical protein
MTKKKWENDIKICFSANYLLCDAASYIAAEHIYTSLWNIEIRELAAINV